MKPPTWPAGSRLALGEPFEIDGLQAFASASIGIAVGRGADVDAEELLRNADVAMYVAKAKGKRRTETFDPSMYKEVQDRLTLEADLRRAVERNEFEVFYQPVWATDTRRMVGVEALVRWRHPSRGLLAPADFIGAAEETGLIVPMGRMVLDRACAQVAAWDRDGGAAAGLSIAVNISPRQLREADLVETIAQALAESGLAADRLNLEITEAVLVDDSAIVADLLRQLKALGVRISIDDFGTGYSSLSYLKRLPDRRAQDRQAVRRRDHQRAAGRGPLPGHRVAGPQPPARGRGRGHRAAVATRRPRRDGLRARPGLPGEPPGTGRSTPRRWPAAAGQRTPPEPCRAATGGRGRRLAIHGRGGGRYWTRTSDLADVNRAL